MNRYISDLHFGHQNILRFDDRPFDSLENMEENIVWDWNNTVSKDDTTYILGDFCWGTEPEWKRILAMLNGHKVLIRGNHDLKNMSASLKSMFDDIKDYKEITDQGRHVIMCHYPILFYKGSYDPKTYMLCGHVHMTRENILLDAFREQTRTLVSSPFDNRGQIYNVGCMMPYIDYMPRTLDEIIKGGEEYIR